MWPSASLLLAAALATGPAADTTPPQIAVTVPSANQVLAADQGDVPANFACRDEIGGSGLASCAGPAAIDTKRLGDHVFTVHATDHAGNAAEKLVHYRVVDLVSPQLAQAVLNAAVPALRQLVHASSATIAGTVRPDSTVAVRVTGRRGATVADGRGRAGADGKLRLALRVRARRLLRGRVHVIVTVAHARRSAVVNVPS